MDFHPLSLRRLSHISVPRAEIDPPGLLPYACIAYIEDYSCLSSPRIGPRFGLFSPVALCWFCIPTHIAVSVNCDPICSAICVGPVLCLISWPSLNSYLCQNLQVSLITRRSRYELLPEIILLNRYSVAITPCLRSFSSQPTFLPVWTPGQPWKDAAPLGKFHLCAKI